VSVQSLRVDDHFTDDLVVISWLLLMVDGGSEIGDFLLYTLGEVTDPPPLKWSDLKYVLWHQGGSEHAEEETHA
jgi:hypothetical protein